MSESDRRNMNCLSFLSNPSVLAEWTDGHPAFECANGAVVRGYLRMLKEAVRAREPGVLPSSSVALAEVTGLREAEVIEMWDVLTNGWVLTNDGNLQHDGVAKHCTAFIREFNEDVNRVHAQIREVEVQFQLSASGAVSKARKAVLRQLPKGFNLTDAHVRWLEKFRGIVDPIHHRFLMDRFLADARAKDQRFVDWDAAFTGNVDMLIRDFGLPAIPRAHPVEGQLLTRPIFGSRSRPNAQEQGVPSGHSTAIRNAREGRHAV